MFKNLFNFSYKRNWKEAIGFYLVYLFISIAVTLLLSTIQGILNELLGVSTPNMFMLVSPLFCLIISILLLKRRGLLKNFGYLLLALLSFILILPPFSVIIPAILSTVEAKK